MKHFLTIFAACLLAACGSMDGKTPAEMMRHSMSRQISHHNQYEFSGRARVEFDFDENDAAPKSEKNAKAAKLLRNLAEGYGKAFSLPYQGAVDLPQGKLEIIPALEAKTRNAYSVIKLPLQLDLKQGTAYADPEAVSYWTDLFLPFVRDIPPVNDRYLALRLPEKWRGKIPASYLAAALPKAVEEAYAVLPADSFVRLDMDEHGRKLGAAYRIGANLRVQDYRLMLSALGDSLHRQLSERRPPADMTAEDYQKALDFLKKLADDKPASDHAEQDKKPSGTLQKLVRQSEWYLDKKGRLLAGSGRTSVPKPLHSFFNELFENPVRVSLHNRYTLHHTKKPQFVIRPTAENTWDISCLLDKQHGCAWLKKSQSQTADSETASPDRTAPATQAPRLKRKRR